MRIVITQSIAEMIRVSPEGIVYEGKRITFPGLDTAEDASRREPNRYALILRQKDEGPEWKVTDIESITE